MATVDLLGDQLLPASSLPQDQDRIIERCHRPDFVTQCHHGGRSTPEVPNAQVPTDSQFEQLPQDPVGNLSG